MIKSLNGNGLWARRRFEILCAIDRMGNRAETKEILYEVSLLEVFTTKGPQESELKSPDHYFRHALRKAMDKGFLESTEGSMAITDVGREVLINGVPVSAFSMHQEDRHSSIDTDTEGCPSARKRYAS